MSVGHTEKDGFINAALGDLSGVMTDSLVASAPACAMQDQCDKLIDIAYYLGGSKKTKLIKLAQSILRSEKNTPHSGQRSVLCCKKPRHKELDGLFPKQDPTGSKKDKKRKPFVPPKFKEIRNLKLTLDNKVIFPNFKRFPLRGNKTKCTYH
ncbi:7835_t:CDS:2 [Gigaspora margarita]|uniref:Prolipoprotein diacylglyceryl transferase n=2 Tax=Gigaspora margarita TaxID=4874 RepID=A0A8H3XCK7_GIGMA|nr:prolipoprotein diacylglyceryl transferase [Gigaspora margarita]CAG8718291.1 7835_t:CDS:2 [Gigaspora margarita]